MKLTQTIRKAILSAALDKAGINQQQQAIRERYAQWAETVRVRYVTPEVVAAVEKAREILSAVNVESVAAGVPELNYEFGIRHANIAGQRRDVYWNGALTYNGSGDITLPAPYYGRVTLTADDPLTEQLYAIDHDAEQLKQRVEHLTASINAYLNAASTDRKLIEIWPEAVAFIPAAERAGLPQLPALPVAELNKLIGLP